MKERTNQFFHMFFIISLEITSEYPKQFVRNGSFYPLSKQGTRLILLRYYSLQEYLLKHHGFVLLKHLLTDNPIVVKVILMTVSPVLLQIQLHKLALN